MSKPYKTSIEEAEKNKIIDTAVEQFADILVASIDEQADKSENINDTA